MHENDASKSTMNGNESLFCVRSLEYRRWMPTTNSNDTFTTDNLPDVERFGESVGRAAARPSA